MIDGEGIEGFPEFEIRGSPVFFGLVCLVFGVLAVGLATMGQVVFSALAVLYAGWAGMRLIRPGKVSVTAAGIVDRTFWYSPGLIPWQEVTDVRAVRWGLIEIDLADEGAFLERLGPLAQMARFKQQLYGFGPALLVPWVLRGTRRSMVDRLQDGLDAFTLAHFKDTTDGALPPGNTRDAAAPTGSLQPPGGPSG